MGIGRHHCQHVVLSDDLVVLVCDFRVPPDLSIATVATQGLLFAGETHAHRVAVVQRSDESQVIDPVIREHRSEVGVDKQAGRERDDQVAVRDAALENGFFAAAASSMCA